MGFEARPFVTVVPFWAAWTATPAQSIFSSRVSSSRDNFSRNVASLVPALVSSLTKVLKCSQETNDIVDGLLIRNKHQEALLLLLLLMLLLLWLPGEISFVAISRKKALGGSLSAEVPTLRTLEFESRQPSVIKHMWSGLKDVSMLNLILCLNLLVVLVVGRSDLIIRSNKPKFDALLVYFKVGVNDILLVTSLHVGNQKAETYIELLICVPRTTTSHRTAFLLSFIALVALMKLVYFEYVILLL